MGKGGERVNAGRSHAPGVGRGFPPCPSWGLLVVVQILTALAGGGAVAWSASRVVAPVVRVCLEAWERPLRCEGGRWAFPDDRVHLVAETRDLAVVVDPGQSGQLRSPALFQVQWGRSSLRVYGPLGWWEVGFPSSWNVELDPEAVRAAWEAWRPFVGLALALGAATVLLVVWYGSACVYGLVVGGLTVLLGRSASVGRVLRVCLTLQIPGAWLMAAGVAGYGMGWLDLPGLAVVAAGHWALTLLLLVPVPFCLPRRGKGGRDRNPFLG